MPLTRGIGAGQRARTTHSGLKLTPVTSLASTMLTSTSGLVAPLSSGRSEGETGSGEVEGDRDPRTPRERDWKEGWDLVGGRVVVGVREFDPDAGPELDSARLKGSMSARPGAGTAWDGESEEGWEVMGIGWEDEAIVRSTRDAVSTLNYASCYESVLLLG